MFGLSLWGCVMDGKVLNKHVHGIPKGAVYIGRGSMWGNPFTSIQRGTTKAITVVATREESIEQYRQWLKNQIRSGCISKQELAELYGKDLVCFCAPKPCHGDILIKAAAWAAGANHE